jgi:7,8-dihydropterin-6-yl-methyl-4-(beta-D-ribofuranosyl)aminobenzene 5'-phosphate synthase
MEARLITLCDNSAALMPDIKAEHGLCFYIEAKGKRFIFDTGQTNVAARNAQILDIDLKGLPIILSHGHYDHTGGLDSILNLTGKTDIYCHQDAFFSRFKLKDRFLKPIGMPWSREYLEEKGAKFHLNSTWREISEGIWLTGEIPRKIDFELPQESLIISSGTDVETIQPDVKMKTDPMQDDQALAIETNLGLLVALGCSHSGLINTLEHVKKMSGIDEIFAVVGGTHLASSSKQRLFETISALKHLDIKLLSPCHCSGSIEIAKLFCELRNRIVFNGVGTQIEI